jgi:signal transduction histidine kinase
MKKILVIEDDASLREFMIKYFLEKHGFNVITAENGAVGLDKAKVELPDLIISDIMMPQMNGYEVLKALQQIPETAEIPFIFLTAMSNRADIRDGMALGADDFLVKPFMSHELLAAINKRFEKQAKLKETANKEFATFREQIARVLPHEFRTPLSTILGVSNILLDEFEEMPKEEMKEMLTYVNISAKRLSRLVENYLLYVSLENITSIDEREANMTISADLLREHVLQFVHRYDRNADLALESDMAQTLTIAISETYFGKMLEELMDNACKFSTKGTTITLGARVEQGRYVISFTNGGLGMTQRQIRDIGAFKQFEREVREQQGAGLGLVLVKRIVELHKGALYIESVPNEYTTFRVSLPLSQEQA